MIKLIKYSFLMIGLFAYSQENTKNNEENVAVSESSQIKNVTLVTYNPTIKIKKLYSDIKQAKNRTPKELLNSLASENSVEWSRWNNYNKELPISDKTMEWFKGRTSIDREKHYSELIQELYFEYNNKQYCWTKEYAHTEFKKERGYGLYSLTNVLIKVGDHWELYNNLVDEVFLREKGNFTVFKSSIFTLICTKQNPDNNPYLAKLLDKVYEGDSLNLNKLYSEVKRMYEENNKNNETKTEEYKYFADEYLF